MGGLIDWGGGVDRKLRWSYGVGEVGVHKQRFHPMGFIDHIWDHMSSKPYMGIIYGFQIICGQGFQIIPTIFDHIWVFIWSLSLTTYGAIYDIKTNHIPTCRQIICQIIYDFKTIYGFDSNHMWLKSNHIWKSIKSYMILNHMWNHIWYWKWITCKIIYREIICQIIYTKSYTTEAYMVPCMIHHVVSYTCVSKYIYLPYVATIYEIICGIIYELFRTICDLSYIIYEILCSIIY